MLRLRFVSVRSERAGRHAAESCLCHLDNTFRWCDNLSNNDPTVLAFMSRAFATMVVQMAFDTKVMSASNNTVYKKKLPLAGEVGRRFVAA